MGFWQKIIDMTYWRYKRSQRVCGHCGERRSKLKGKVNYGFVFEQPKKLYHSGCWLVENRKRKEAAK